MSVATTSAATGEIGADITERGQMLLNVGERGGGWRRNKRRRNQQSEGKSHSSDEGGEGRQIPAGKETHWHNSPKTARISTENRSESIGIRQISGGASDLLPSPTNDNSRRTSNQLLPSRAIPNQPKAPNNTTSFLMSDREERQHGDDQQQEMALENGKMRARSCSVLGSARMEVNEAADGKCSGDDGEEEQRDTDFEECLFSTAIERIERLSREEVNQELLLIERANRTLLQRVALLKENQQQLQEENQKLKNLLKANGINTKEVSKGLEDTINDV